MGSKVDAGLGVVTVDDGAGTEEGLEGVAGAITGGVLAGLPKVKVSVSDVGCPGGGVTVWTPGKGGNPGENGGNPVFGNSDTFGSGGKLKWFQNGESGEPLCRSEASAGSIGLSGSCR